MVSKKGVERIQGLSRTAGAVMGGAGVQCAQCRAEGLQLRGAQELNGQRSAPEWGRNVAQTG